MWYSVSIQAASSRFSSASPVTDAAARSPSSTRNCSRTVRKNRSIFPRPWGRPGAECTSLIPRTAHARSSHASTNAEPLSTYTLPGTPRAASAGRSAAARRTVSSLNPNLAAITAREWSSMKAKR